MADAKHPGTVNDSIENASKLIKKSGSDAVSQGLVSKTEDSSLATVTRKKDSSTATLRRNLGQLASKAIGTDSDEVGAQAYESGRKIGWKAAKTSKAGAASVGRITAAAIKSRSIKAGAKATRDEAAEAVRRGKKSLKAGMKRKAGETAGRVIGTDSDELGAQAYETSRKLSWKAAKAGGRGAKRAAKKAKGLLGSLRSGKGALSSARKMSLAKSSRMMKSLKATQSALAAQAAATNGVRAAAARVLAAMISAITSILPVLLVAILAIIVIIVIVTLVITILGGSQKEKVSLDGMPDWVTYDLVLACLQAHEDYGYPAGALLGQMIIENGVAGSDLGDYHNYGGVKYSGNDYGGLITGSVQMLTGEYDYNGIYYSTYAAFAVFADDDAFMKYRCQYLLQQSNYTSVADYQTAIQNNDSELFLRALGEGGYYTASQDKYVASYRSLCEQYPLISELDSMTVAEFKERFAGSASGAATYSGGGEDYDNAEDWQKRIVDAAYSTGSTGDGWCAAWVTNVYSNAGMGSLSGNGNTILNGCSDPRTDFDNIKVGQILSAQYGYEGNGYGHTGIYVGNGIVRHQGSWLQDSTLDYWLSTYNGGWIIYGWPW